MESLKIILKVIDDFEIVSLFTVEKNTNFPHGSHTIVYLKNKMFCCN